MLSYDIRLIESQSQQVDGWLDPDDPSWGPDDVVPVDPGVHVSGRLSAAGQGRFYFSGALRGESGGSCRRCLGDVTSLVDEPVHIIFAEADLDDADEDDVFVLPANTRELDLREAVREQWLLAVPQFALCRDDCRGLCPDCGADRNAGACSCAPAIDPRWAALRFGQSSALDA